MKKINKNDIFINEVTYYPKYEWYYISEENYLALYNQRSKYFGSFSEDRTDLFEIAVNSVTASQFIINKKQYQTYGGYTLQNVPYGTIITSSLALSSSITSEPYEENATRPRINALKNTINFYGTIDPIFNYDNFSTSSLLAIYVPSIFYGSSIKKGTLELKTLITSGSTSTQTAYYCDLYKNGIIYNISSSQYGIQNTKVGICLYSEGVILSTDDSFGDNIGTCSQFILSYNGTTKINRMNIFAECGKIEFNNSNNPTYKQNISGSSFVSSSKGYIENEYQQIYNINSSSYSTYDSDYEKVTYITSIGLFDADKNLVGIAKLSKPLKKTINDSYTFKLKYDI